jgi:hypothetical protein
VRRKKTLEETNKELIVRKSTLEETNKKLIVRKKTCKPFFFVVVVIKVYITFEKDHLQMQQPNAMNVKWILATIEHYKIVSKRVFEGGKKKKSLKIINKVT